jgi:hypothetical protein
MPTNGKLINRDPAERLLEELELGYTEGMGPKLRLEVERQLSADIARYGVEVEGLTIDWSNTCPEGHATTFLDGNLENWSGVRVRGKDGTIVAEGWLDFIHGGGSNPLFVFWDFLTIYEGNQKREGKRAPGIPQHIWDQLPVTSKDLCTRSDTYDAAWSNDPLVIKWQHNKGRSG